MKLIPLTRGQFAIVDDEDYDELMKHRWQARFTGNRNMFDVRRMGPRDALGRRKGIKMARQILGLAKDNKLNADHINHNTLDNRRSNLRGVTSHQNQMNRRGHVNTTSKYKGVFWLKRKLRWKATIYVNGKNIHLGSFRSENDAANAYNKAAKKYHGEFACLNVIE